MIAAELTMPATLGEILGDFAGRQKLEELEQRLLTQPEDKLELCELVNWRDFASQLQQTWRDHDHVIVRDIPVDDGATTILAALALGTHFKPYRGDKIVKHFKMSPWTTELSQTLRAGHFHTDLSTAPQPPRATVIHCRTPDPTPDSGVVRIARLRDLLAELGRVGAAETVKFMTETETEMVDERASGSWSGPLVADEGTIRLHPECLRAAERRSQRISEDLEQHLSQIHESALAVSTPITLDRGDAVFVSNTRALHYRGPCTARYLEFPRKFDAREIYVLHLCDEPRWLQ